jgi:hypothetical protein
MKDTKTSKERKHEHAMIVCSIIGRRGSYSQFKCKIYFTPDAYQIETMFAKTLEAAIAAFKKKYPNVYSVEKA